MAEAVIQVEKLSKCYRIRHERGGGRRERYTALRDVIADKFKGFFKMLKTEKLKRGNPDVSISAFQHFSLSVIQDVSMSACQLFSVSAFDWIDFCFLLSQFLLCL